MNLITDPWLPFQLVDGSEQKLPICAIYNPDVVDFALPRADFKGAAYQFAIGLLQTTFAPATANDWHDLYEQAPTPEQLTKAFDTVAHAFKAVGDGPLFMQDFDPLESVKSTTVAGLLIEAPGANGIKLNTDHFIKRGIGEVMSLEMAILALFTLQINAPSGGAGHRVGLRGGGPLTTVILPQKATSTLWQKLWLNVINLDFARYDQPDLNSAMVFPWLAPTKASDKKGTEIYASDVHPLHMYWAMPRRIRLEVQQGEQICQITGEGLDQFVSSYRTQNYGNNYSGTWSHPLTPYKWDPKKPDEEHLSIKGQPGGITYKTWDVLTLNSDAEGQHCASVVSHFNELVDDFDEFQTQTPRLWAFAYDMDNMKARGWYSTTMPLFSVSVKDQERLVRRIKALQKLASNALWHCRTQIKTAWFDNPGDASGDMSFIDLAFWQRTESAFYQAVSELIENTTNGNADLSSTQAYKWLTALRNTAIDLFDEYALSELGNERSMAKRIKARQSLTGWLFGGKDIKDFIAIHQIEQTKEIA